MIDTAALRKKVLELAMTGKLSKYQSDDDKIDDVLSRISKEKEDLLKQRNGRKDNNLKERDEHENDEMPENWAWIRFGETGLFKKGPFGSALTKSMFVPKSKDTVKVYEQQHVINKKHSLGTYYITRQYFEESMSGFEVQPGDIVVSCAGTIGETYVMPEDIEQGIINQALMRVSLIPSIYNKFFLYYFEYGLKKAAQEESNGSAIKNIPPLDVMKNWSFPITSIQEQKRIVENIEEMYYWIDKIDVFQADYASDIEILKSKIIDAGIQGKLTEQLPEDGTAEELLEQIVEEKKQLIKAKKIKAAKTLHEITEDEIPFEIPENWKWVHLNNTGILQTGATPPKTNPDFFGNAIPFLSPGDIQDNTIVAYNNQGLSNLGIEKARVVDENSVLQVCIGGSIGKAAINDRKVTFNQQINSVTPILCEAKYLFYCMVSSYFMGKIQIASAGAATPIINKSKWGELLIPLPPLAEQKRIIERITQILEQI